MKQLGNVQRTKRIVKVLESCKTIEQLESCVGWIARLGWELDLRLSHLDCADELTSKYYEVKFRLTGDKNC